MSPLMRKLWAWLQRTALLAIGVPDYETYLAHMQKKHPDKTPMSRDEFFVERMNARYARGSSRCC